MRTLLKVMPVLGAAMILSLVVSVCLGRETERVRIAFAKTVAGIESQPELPDQPPNIRLNVPGVNVRLSGAMRLEITGDPVALTEAETKPFTVLPLPEMWLVVDPTGRCAPCDEAKRQLEKHQAKLPFRVVIKTQVPFAISSYPTFLWSPTLGSPADSPKTAVQLRGWWGLDETLKIFNKSRTNTPPQRRLTADELKSLVSNWSGPEVGIVGMTAREHLMDSRHGFTADQLGGLSESELRVLHSAHHAGAISPVMSPVNSLPSSNEGATESSGVAGTSGAAGFRGPVGVLYGRSQIETLLTWWRNHLGDSAVARVEWNRNGSQKLPLLRLTEWTPPAVYGTSGSFAFSVAGATTHSLPITDALLDYRIANGKLRLRGETAIDPEWLSVVPGRTEAMSAGDPVSMIDPMTVLSVISMIVSLLNPQADLLLPGSLVATASLQGDRLVVVFEEAPSLRLVRLLQLNLKVESVEIAADRVLAKFSGSRLVTDWKFDVR